MVSWSTIQKTCYPFLDHGVRWSVGRSFQFDIRLDLLQRIEMVKAVFCQSGGDAWASIEPEAMHSRGGLDWKYDGVQRGMCLEYPERDFIVWYCSFPSSWRGSELDAVSGGLQGRKEVATLSVESSEANDLLRELGLCHQCFVVFQPMLDWARSGLPYLNNILM